MLDESMFVSDDLHEREVQIGKSKKVKLHFRELPAVEFIRNNLSQSDPDVHAGAVAKLIAACVCNPDGSPAMSYEKALTLKQRALSAIYAVVMEINWGEPGKE